MNPGTLEAIREIVLDEDAIDLSDEALIRAVKRNAQAELALYAIDELTGFDYNTMPEIARKAIHATLRNLVNQARNQQQ